MNDLDIMGDEKPAEDHRGTSGFYMKLKDGWP